MGQNEIMEQVGKLHADNPAKFIKIRDIFDDIFGDRKMNNALAISDFEFQKVQRRFREIDLPFSWCISKEAVYQLQKAVSYHRAPSRDRRNDRATAKKSSKSKKKGLFGLFE